MERVTAKRVADNMTKAIKCGKVKQIEEKENKKKKLKNNRA